MVMRSRKDSNAPRRAISSRRRTSLGGVRADDDGLNGRVATDMVSLHFDSGVVTATPLGSSSPTAWA
jgi:hypothetical protein